MLEDVGGRGGGEGGGGAEEKAAAEARRAQRRRPPRRVGGRPPKIEAVRDGDAETAAASERRRRCALRHRSRRPARVPPHRPRRFPRSGRRAQRGRKDAADARVQVRRRRMRTDAARCRSRFAAPTPSSGMTSSPVRRRGGGVGGAGAPPGRQWSARLIGRPGAPVRAEGRGGEERIYGCLAIVILFKLDVEVNTVVGAMEEVAVKAGDPIITQATTATTCTL